LVRIFGTKRGDIRQQWSDLLKELHDVYSSQVVMMLTNSWQMRWKANAISASQNKTHTIFSADLKVGDVLRY
jgi:hypothetical protein